MIHQTSSVAVETVDTVETSVAEDTVNISVDLVTVDIVETSVTEDS